VTYAVGSVIQSSKDLGQN